MQTLASLPAWPDGADVAVALTFDVDGQAPWLSESPENTRRLTILSQGQFGPVRGLSRILAMLDETGIPATFYIPGHTAEHHPEAMAAILERGHEVAHHGTCTRRPTRWTTLASGPNLERGLEALDRYGVRPAGYRLPGWELTPETLGLLAKLGFRYDSSLMADDRPYWETWERRRILELPVHWSLDDWPRFGWSLDGGGNATDPAGCGLLAGRV
jgi:peptidoglycan/xylan/chitin deacetylase (PgdA/CDA1 family)